MSLLTTEYYDVIMEDGILQNDKRIEYFEKAAYSRIPGGNVLVNYCLTCKQGDTLVMKAESSCQLFYKNDGIEIADMQIAEELLKIMNYLVAKMKVHFSSTRYNFQWAGLHPDLTHSTHLLAEM